MTHAGKVKAEIAKKLAETRYDEFDKNRKKQEALKADEEDIKELQALERQLLQKSVNK